MLKLLSDRNHLLMLKHTARLIALVSVTGLCFGATSAAAFTHRTIKPLAPIYRGAFDGKNLVFFSQANDQAPWVVYRQSLKSGLSQRIYEEPPENRIVWIHAKDGKIALEEDLGQETVPDAPGSSTVFKARSVPLRIDGSQVTTIAEQPY